MVQQWEARPPPSTPAKDPLYALATHTPGPAEPTRQEKRATRKVGETEQRTATPAAEPGHLRALRVVERKRGCDGVATVTTRSTAPANRGGQETNAPDRGRTAPAGAPQLGALEAYKCLSETERRRAGDGHPRTRSQTQDPTPRARGAEETPPGEHTELVRRQHTTDHAKGVPTKRPDPPAPKKHPTHVDAPLDGPRPGPANEEPRGIMAAKPNGQAKRQLASPTSGEETSKIK